MLESPDLNLSSECKSCVLHGAFDAVSLAILTRIIPCTGQEFVRCLLVDDPAVRMTMICARAHPWLASISRRSPHHTLPPELPAADVSVDMVGVSQIDLPEASQMSVVVDVPQSRDTSLDAHKATDDSDSADMSLMSVRPQSDAPAPTAPTPASQRKRKRTSSESQTEASAPASDTSSSKRRSTSQGSGVSEGSESKKSRINEESARDQGALVTRKVVEEGTSRGQDCDDLAANVQLCSKRSPKLTERSDRSRIFCRHRSLMSEKEES
jgi:hypothetical protein